MNTRHTELVLLKLTSKHIDRDIQRITSHNSHSHSHSQQDSHYKNKQQSHKSKQQQQLYLI